MNQLNTLIKSNRSKIWPMRILEAMLLIVSAWRTWDFISLIMQDLPGVTFYALFSVTISEGAYLVWSKFAYPNADQGNQESVTIGMIFLNTVGLMLLSFGENLLRAASSFAWSQSAGEILAYTPWAMLAFNLIGALLFGILDDDHIDSKTRKAQERIDRNAERDLTHAERMSHINAKLAAIQQLQDQAPEIAQALSPYYVRSIRDRVASQTMRNLNLTDESADPPHSGDLLQRNPIATLEDDLISISNNGGNHRPKAI